MAAKTLQTPKVKLANKITFSGHKGPVTCLSLSKDSSLLASSSEVRFLERPNAHLKL